jgi:RHS repeat-associated protein
MYDGHGSVRGLIDAEGKLTDTYNYDAFGVMLERTGETENSYLYCGEQQDDTTGLYYLRARYMNPATGTFTSMDTYGGSVFDPTSLHKYLYANANPVSYTDPSGYFSLPELTVSMTIMDCIKFTAFSAIVGAVTGFVFGTIDSLLGGKGLGEALLDGLKAAGWGALIGAAIGALMCFATYYAWAITVLQVARYAFLVWGAVGVGISIYEGHPAQAIFRGLMALFAFNKMGKAIEGIKLIRLKNAALNLKE